MYTISVSFRLDPSPIPRCRQGTNVVSALVDTVTRLVVQRLLEAEQAGYLGDRGLLPTPGERDQVGSRNGYEPGRLRTAEGAIGVTL